MARQEIILGTPPLGLGGDPPRAASMKINAMTQELYQGLATTAAPLPITKGGTGAKTKAEAKLALDIVPVVGVDDVTGGRLVTPGWMGIGNTGVQPTLPSLLAHLPTGSYRGVGNVTIGSPVTDTASGFMVFAQRYSTSDTCYRVIFPSVRRYFEGWYTGSNTTIPWVELTTDFNTISGSNANGSFIKYPDGNMVQWGLTGATPDTVISGFYGATAGTLYYINTVKPFPTAFYNTLYSITGTARDRGIVGLMSANNAANFNCQFRNNINSAEVTTNWTAWGRWKA